MDISPFSLKYTNRELPGSVWNYNFSEHNGITKVGITIVNESLACLEKMIEMGFEPGFKMSIDNLENYWPHYRKNDPRSQNFYHNKKGSQKT